MNRRLLKNDIVEAINEFYGPFFEDDKSRAESIAEDYAHSIMQKLTPQQKKTPKRNKQQKQTKNTIPRNVHIVHETVIPEDGEQYSKIVGVFAYKRDATKLVKKLMMDYIKDHDIVSAKNTKKLNVLMYGQTGKWSPRGKFWMRPRWSIDTHKLTPRTKK